MTLPTLLRPIAALLPVPLLAGCMPEPDLASHVLTPAESSCLAAVAEATERGDVEVTGLTETETGSLVTLQAMPAGGVWACRTDESGMVQQLSPQSLQDLP